MLRNPTTDLIVVLVIVLLIFGPKRLPGTTPLSGSGEATAATPPESANVPAAGSSEVPAERRS